MRSRCSCEALKSQRFTYFCALIFLAILVFSLNYNMFFRKTKSKEKPNDLKLLPEEKYKTMFLFDGIWLGPKNHCECAQKKGFELYQLDKYIDEDKCASLTERREKEFRDYQRRYSFKKKAVLVAQPNIPLSYPMQGAVVTPLHTIVIPGLGFHGTKINKRKVFLQASFGELNTLADVSEDVVQGRGEKELIISTPHVALLNHILQHVTYTSTQYLLDVVDMVTFQMGVHRVKFPVVIQQPPLPLLFDPGPDNNIRNLVTITTKTFLRYHKLRLLIRSIRKYYPDITIIVADDSEHPETIHEANVEQYIMPFGKGWFAGRNLAVSQVTTKYFLWVDDDFLFTAKTKIETLVDVLENTNLDVVGGSVGGNHYKLKIIVEEGERNSCVHIRYGGYHPLEGFPGCVVTSGVVNFFLARTLENRRIGFDPKLQRVAHLEYFLDGLGSLRVGSCSHIEVSHQSQGKPTDPNEYNIEKSYAIFRSQSHQDVRFKLALQYFKNRMKCYTKNA